MAHERPFFPSSSSSALHQQSNIRQLQLVDDDDNSNSSNNNSNMMNNFAPNTYNSSNITPHMIIHSSSNHMISSVATNHGSTSALSSSLYSPYLGTYMDHSSAGTSARARSRTDHAMDPIDDDDDNRNNINIMSTCSSSSISINTSSNTSSTNILHSAPHHGFLLVIDELRSSAKLKAEMVSHPLFEHLLRAHVQCLSVGLPPDQVRALEDQLANTHSVAIKYLMLSKDDDDHGDHHRPAMAVHHEHAANKLLLPQQIPVPRGSSSSPSGIKENIDEFMENYLQLLMILRRHLEEYVIPQSSNAMDALCELEQAFCDLTGASPDEISSARNANHELNEEYTTPDHELGEVECAGVDPLYDIDRSLFEYVRMELKHKLKDRYRESIVAIRDEIIRKRLAGKLPGDVTVLKKWWNAHSKWPYPTEDEKKRMMDETGLEMRQINNWFINHRKRNWNSRAPNSSSGSSSHMD